VERDRARIAKDIHDDIGAGLTHISLLSELARRDSVENIHNHVSQISEMSRELTLSMDEIVWAVDPHNDSLDSLVTYVTKFAQEYLGVAGVRCRLDLPAELPGHPLRAEVRHNLFLAIKETLNNIVKHAHASEVWLRLVLEPHAFTVSIEDNGCGIAASDKSGDATRAGRISSGHGLENLRKRLETVGGQCIITSEPGKGTKVEMRVDSFAS
jgi:signal transduction histidine kinase